MSSQYIEWYRVKKVSVFMVDIGMKISCLKLEYYIEMMVWEEEREEEKKSHFDKVY